MIQKKSIVNTIKKAFQSGSIQLIGQDLTQFPPQLLNLENFDLGDQKWWDSNPITKYDFSNNEIRVIPQTIGNLKDVQVIRFKSNLLSTLPKEIFFQTLKLLDVSKNKIEHLPKQLYNATSLVQLNLSNNNLVECPNVSSITSLEILYIDNNKIQSLVNLPSNLKRLDASSNSLTVIKESFFSSALSLEQIMLNKNMIKEVEAGSFMRCSKLITLEMKENRLERFEEVPFSEKLDNIALNYNRIKEFNKFENCPNLTVLILADNKLEKLSGDIVSLKKLKTLDISNNDLSDLPSELGLLPQLVRIQLDGNPLKCIRPNIRSSGVEQLKRYLKDRIDPTKLQVIEKKTIDPKYSMNSSLDHWDKLIMEFTTGNDLDLRNKNLTILDPRVYKKTLRTLNVSQNSISQIGEEIERMAELKVLNAGENAIQSLPKSLLSLSTLDQIDLKRNKISEFFNKNCKSHLMNLYFLDLSVNKLSEVPGILTEFPRIRIIHLSYNKITNMEIFFKEKAFTHLETIDVSNNQIEEVSESVWNRSGSLNFLNLQNNNLMKLPTVVGFMKLTALKVEGNPLKLIKRATIVKGTVALLEDLRNKHIGNPPQALEPQVETKQQKQYFQNPSHSKQQMHHRPYQQPTQPKSNITHQSKAEIEHRIKEITKRITEMENQIENNFSLNKIQKTEKRRAIQQLMVERSQQQQLLK